MSADNYGVIHRTEDGFGLSMGFASDDETISFDRPYFTAKTLREVVAYANEEYFEYGWDFSPQLEAWLIDRAEKGVS